jgi:hypothetical protein
MTVIPLTGNCKVLRRPLAIWNTYPMPGQIIGAALMCHAPIVLPEIAGNRSAEIAKTTAAMEEAATHLLARQPDVIVILSPHAPRSRGSFV